MKKGSIATLRRFMLAGCAGLAFASGASAQTTGNSRPEDSDVTSNSETPTSGGVDIIVTASRRSERLREVSNSVTAFTGEDLSAKGAKSFADYLVGAPGVQFQAATPGVSNVTIRGVGTATIFPDQGQSTTGIYLNDIPLTDPGFALSIPDLNVFDVQRIEVLRGPQGTLFGTATLGGAVNYILNPVNPSEFEGEVAGGLSTTAHASKIGHTISGMLNIPVVKDVLGIRVAVSDAHDPGYLDNIGTGKKDSNGHDNFSVRFMALWQISPRATLNYFGFYDRGHNRDSSAVFTGLGRYVRDSFVPETGTYKTEIHSLKFDNDFDFATLTLAGAYTRKKQDAVFDFTALFGGPQTTILADNERTKSKTFEARLTSPSGQKLEWLFGVYVGRFDEKLPNPTFQNGVNIGDFIVDYYSKELSEFGEVTYHLDDKLKVSVGGRHYHIDLETQTTIGLPGDYAITRGKQTGDGFSPKASITYTASPDFMIYGLVSRGFRMGGVNLVPPIASFPTPATYGSDSLTNYEIGIRTSWLDRTLLVDVTPFYIDWSNIQLRLSRPDGRSYVANAGASRNYGVETAITWRPTSRFDLTANVTYLDSALSESLALGNGTVIAKGTTLPGASKWSTSETATYRFDLPSEPYISLSHRYVSKALSAFQGSLPVAGYHAFDLRAGVTFGSTDLTVYANNITDRRGVTAAAFVGDEPTAFYIRPRTIGVRLNHRM